MKRNRIRYWIQKYLRQHIGENFSALVLDVLRGRCRILLTDFLLVTEMKRDNGQDFFEGQQITVTVKKSDPWNDLLNLEYTGQ
jgi:exoribonuclease R